MHKAANRHSKTWKTGVAGDPDLEAVSLVAGHHAQLWWTKLHYLTPASRQENRGFPTSLQEAIEQGST